MYPKDTMKILSWDIEASNLAADFGIIFCVGFKEVGKGKPKVFSLLDYDETDVVKAERLLLQDVSRELLTADVWLTHYGTWFDIPFVNSRLLWHKLPVLPPTFAHIDTWKISRNRLKLSSNRLATIQNFLGTEDTKNAIKPLMWVRALGGHRPSMRYIVEHCRRDVLVLEEAYRRIRPLVLDHPSRGLVDGRGGCGVCGAAKLQARGFHVTRTRKYQRYQCQSCGAWSKGIKPLMVLK